VTPGLDVPHRRVAQCGDWATVIVFHVGRLLCKLVVEVQVVQRR
jgi:hypothetical protein